MNKVFCIGLSRTGTTSLCRGLEVLGYKSLHFSLPLFVHPEIISPNLSFVPQRKLNLYRRWRRNLELRSVTSILDPQVFDKFDVFGDLPFPQVFKTLDEKFPNSKFIYTYRDEEKWLKSMKWLFHEGNILYSAGLLQDEMNLKMYQCYQYDPTALLRSYRDHHKKVLSHFANRPDDILVINIDEERIDFKKLCAFLGKPVPEIPFPTNNPSRKASGRARLNYWLTKEIPFYKEFKTLIKRPLSAIGISFQINKSV